MAFTRKAAALLVALAILFGLVPVAASAHDRAPAASAMAMMDPAMPCDHSMPAPKSPCKDMQSCPCLLGCVALATLPKSFAPQTIDYFELKHYWGSSGRRDGISLQPSLPPPIV